MKQAIWIFFFFICLCVFSCKESDNDDSSVGNNTTQSDQDQDTATITGDDYIYHLPVIFHVLYQDSKDDSTQYIAHKRLKNILGYVNELYQGNVYGESENIHVQFELAEYDEKGNKLSTPGVEYIKYTATYPIDCDKFMEGNVGNGKSHLWNPNEYINVFVYNFAQDKSSSGTTLGISHMPYKALGYPELEGLDSVETTKLNKSNFGFPYCVSINSIYADAKYYESSRYTDPYKGQKGNSSYSSVDISVTLAHELGHFLGLHHIFTQDENGEIADSCADTDYCEDTPSYNRPEYQEWVSWLMKDMHAKGEQVYMDTVILRTNCNGEKWRSANLLDYSYSLGYKFSKDQATRMRQVLYYSPALPGPKKKRSSTRSGDQGVEGILNIPIRIVKCTLPKLQ